MKRSRERRTTRRLATTPPPPGSGSDVGGADGSQQHEDDKTSASAAPTAAKRKRVRTRSRTPPPQSRDSDKASTRLAMMKTEETKGKSAGVKLGHERREKAGKSDASSSEDGSDHDDEIPISQLAKRVTKDDADVDGFDQAQEQSRAGPQTPLGVGSVKTSKGAKESHSSEKRRDQATSSAATSGRPNRVKERDKDEMDKPRLKRSAIQIESTMDESSSQPKACGSSDDDVVIIEKADQSQAGEGRNCEKGPQESFHGQTDSDRYVKGHRSGLKRKRVQNGSALLEVGDQGDFVSDGDFRERKVSHAPSGEPDINLGHCAERTTGENEARRSVRTRDSDSVPSVNEIKTELYLEGIKVHRGRGSERRFADYWDALNRYISSGSQSKRFCSDKSSLGIEAELKSFLKTKKLRRLHNQVILAIMKQSMQDKVPTTMYKRHLPSRWRRQVQIKSDGPPLLSPPVGDKGKPYTVESVAALQQRKDEVDIERLRNEFGCSDSDLWTSVGNRVMVNNRTLAGAESVQRDSSEKHIPEMSLPTANLPGALSIDPTVRGLAVKEGMKVSENAIWLLVVAVRAHASSVLRHTISEMEAIKNQLSHDGSTSNGAGRKEESGRAQGERETLNMKDGVKGDGASGSVQRKTRSTITVFDMAQALTSNPMLGSGSTDVSKSRATWERCISAANGTLSTSSSVHMDVSQSIINENIRAASRRRQAMPASLGSEKEKAFKNPGAQADGSHKASTPTKPNAATVNAVTSSADAEQKKVQGGKDLSSMKKTAVPVESGEEAGSKAAENGDSSPIRPSSTSPPARRGRGFGAKNLAAMRAGAKNLAAMRARRTTSTGGKSEEKDDENQKEGDKDKD